MKKRFLITALVFAVMMFMAGTLSVFADVSTEAYEYTITVYAGQQGHFEPSGSTISGLPFELKDGGKTLIIKSKPTVETQHLEKHFCCLYYHYSAACSPFKHRI